MNFKQIAVIPKPDGLPIFTHEIVDIFTPLFGQKLFVRLYNSAISAGFPSPADDFLDKELDLNEYLINNKSATFYCRVTGDSMKGGGILDDALLIIDKSLNPVNGDIVLAVINGELTCKRIRRENKKVYLQAENEKYPDILITEDMNFKIWGVVVSVINNFRKNPKKS